MPKIITAAQQGLAFQNLFGPLGDEFYVTAHHTAGPRDRSDRHAMELNERYHREHAAKRWGGIGYHFNIATSGTLICLRPVALKGAHVGGYNSHNVGVMFHGTLGHTVTKAQIDTFLWLLRNAHKRAMPPAHRTDLRLRKPFARRLGHHDWPGHESNACPGTIGMSLFNKVGK